MDGVKTYWIALAFINIKMHQMCCITAVFLFHWGNKCSVALQPLMCRPYSTSACAVIWFFHLLCDTRTNSATFHTPEVTKQSWKLRCPVQTRKQSRLYKYTQTLWGKKWTAELQVSSVINISTKTVCWELHGMAFNGWAAPLVVYPYSARLHPHYSAALGP